MDHLLSLGLESPKGPRTPHDTGSPPSDMHKHNPLSEKLTSMLGLPEEQIRESKDSSHHGNLSLQEKLLRRISGNTVESGPSSTHNDTASSVGGQQLTNKLIEVFHEVVAPPSSTNHDDRPDRPQWVGIATAAIGSIQHRTGSGHPGSTPGTPPGTSQSQSNHPDHHRFMDKLSGVFDGREVGQKEENKAAGIDGGEKARHGDHHLPLDMFEKLGLGQQHPTAPHDTIPPKSHEESILDRLGSTVYHASPGHDSDHATTKAQNPLDLAGRILHHHPDDTKSGGISDKIQSALGGGSAAEANEDDLDKAIDFIQKHILHQGTQSRETILGQMKDEQIARTIRAQYKHLTGREFPLKKGRKHFT